MVPSEQVFGRNKPPLLLTLLPHILLLPLGGGGGGPFYPLKAPTAKPVVSFADLVARQFPPSSKNIKDSGDDRGKRVVNADRFTPVHSKRSYKQAKKTPFLSGYTTYNPYSSKRHNGI